MCNGCKNYAARLASQGMTPASRLIEKAIAWARDRADVRRLVLVGSRAEQQRPDELADVDFQVHTTNVAAYTASADWLLPFGTQVVCVRDRYFDGPIHVPTRLVIFDEGVKVDFAFYPAGTVSSGLRQGRPHLVLIDKDPSPPIAPTHDFDRVNPPTEDEFRRVVEEFWFEAWHVAKYLARGELWLAKMRDWATKQFLLVMIGWNSRFAHGQTIDPDAEGSRDTMDRNTWRALHGTFTAFERDEAWKGATATRNLFRELATQTALSLGYTYPSKTDAQISRLIASIAEGAGFPPSRDEARPPDRL